ncbi:MAG TPA: hypothetical protein VFD62_02280 [Pyrinomonadaceae bacterium]|nr:hypothetical protein [Pyrinomonadaceae bacterium]
MSRLFLIGLAGFVAPSVPTWLAGVVARRYGETIPLGTLVVNFTV